MSGSTDLAEVKLLALGTSRTAVFGEPVRTQQQPSKAIRLTPFWRRSRRIFSSPNGLTPCGLFYLLEIHQNKITGEKVHE